MGFKPSIWKVVASTCGYTTVSLNVTVVVTTLTGGRDLWPQKISKFDAETFKLHNSKGIKWKIERGRKRPKGQRERSNGWKVQKEFGPFSANSRVIWLPLFFLPTWFLLKNAAGYWTRYRARWPFSYSYLPNLQQFYAQRTAEARICPWSRHVYLTYCLGVCVCSILCIIQP